MSDQVWPWVLVIVIVVLVGVVALLARRRSTGDAPAEPPVGAPEGTAPVGPEATGAVTTPDVVTPGSATADPSAVTAGPVTPADEEEDAPAADTPAEQEAGPAGDPGETAAGEAPPTKPAADGPEQPGPGGKQQPPAMDSALASLDARLAGGTPPRRPEAAADAVASVMAQARPGPHPGSALPNPDGYAPSTAFTIKANEGSKRYHDLESPYYVRTRADLWFHSTRDAERAGFAPWNGRRTGT